jgi:hypothetical protein
MTTAWTLPTIITQFAEPGAEEAHIEWDDSTNLEALLNSDGRSIQTNGSLQHIARSPKHDITNKTYYIRATGFNFSQLPDSLTGIEVKLQSRRYGRATDDTIQLSINGNEIGDNKADRIIKPEKIYGSETDTWASELSISDLTDPSFGITIRFRAHPDWPHKDPVLVDSVEMRIH